MRRLLGKLFIEMLVMVTLVTVFPSMALRVQARTIDSELQSSATEVTRAEWLSRLADTFEMTVEDDYYPDNYFNDLDSSSEYYYDVLLNVEFGVIDVETGGEVRPDDPATREFAAHTLNYCLGYQVDETMAATCNDIDESKYRDDIYIAINRGWFELVDGYFLPEQNITLAEVEVMLEDAINILASMEVDLDAIPTYELADDIIVITKECDEITFDENEIATIVVADLRETIVTGNRFAIYQNEIPTVYVADVVSINENITTITASIDDSGDAYVSVDAEGVISGSIAHVEALDGAELVFVDEETSEEYEDVEQIIALYGATSKKLTNTTVVVKKEIELGEGLKGELELKLKNAKVTYDIKESSLSAYAYLECDTELTFNCEADLDAYSPINDIKLVNWTVPGIGGFVVSVDLDLKASASGVHKGYLKTGVDVGIFKGVRMINGFKAKSFTLVAQAKADLNLTAKFGITEMPVLNAYIYAQIGGITEITRTEWVDSKLPSVCVDFSAYLYAKYGAIGSLKIFSYEKSISIEKTLINEKNSPIRCVKHYDDGIEVTECGRDAITEDDSSSGTTTTPKRYVTPASSSWSGSYWSSGTQSAGKDDSGSTIPLYDYSVNSDGETVTITGYNGSSTSLIIPATLDGYTVTVIGGSVFRKNSKLEMTVIPDSVVEIQAGAFGKCSNLSSVNLPKSLITIGAHAFYDCDNLVSIEIPKSLEGTYDAYINEFAYDYQYGPFYGCDNLKKISFEEGVTSIPSGLFANCPGIETIDMPDTITSIGTKAFLKCDNLKDIDFSEGLSTIGSMAFAYCVEIEKVNIPDSVNKIDGGAFGKCTNLSSVKLPKALTTIVAHAFFDCDSLESIEIPKNLKQTYDTYIYEFAYDYQYGAFYGCDNLKNVTFEEGTTTIANGLFANCSGIEKIDMVDTITSIGNEAFLKCANLKEIDFSEGLSAIGSMAFAYCTNIEKVDISDSVNKIGGGAFGKCTNLSAVELPKALSSMGAHAFFDCDSLESIEIPKNLEETYDVYIYEFVYDYQFGPFYGCDNLKSASFQEGSTTIANNLFANCNGLEEVEILNTITTIEGSVFENCTSLKKVNIPDSVTSVGTYVFSGCTSLEEVHLPKGRVNITEGTFLSCTSLQTIELPDSVQYIRENAFQNSGLIEIDLPESVLEIGDNAFRDCTSLADIDMKDGVQVIGNYAFRNDDALTIVKIPDSVTEIGSYAFYHCDALQKVNIPDSVTYLGTYIFKNCAVLMDVSLGLGITNIPQYTFADCGKLASVVIPYNVTTINNYAFTNCTSLTGITIPQKTTSISGNVFSYPSKMTVYGVSGSYAETYASEQGMTFVDQSVPATKVSFAESSYTLNRNSTMTLVPSITPSNFTDLITWKSSDTSVATVDENGVVKGVAVGTATIKVSVGNVSASCKISVVQPVTSISLNKTSLSLEAMETYTLTATANPSSAYNRDIQWSSSDESIATVSESGMVTALAKGSCKITASAMDGSGVTRSCTVTVTNNAYIVDTIDGLQSSHPYENDCNDFWQYTIVGAIGLEVTFDTDTCMEDGFDYLYIFDGEGNQVGKYTGGELSGKTVTIDDDTIRIQIDTDDASNEYGFKVAQVSAVTLSPSPAPTVSPTSSPAPTTAPDDSSEAQVAAFVERMYTVALGRASDSEGIAYWTEQLLTYEIDGAGLSQGFILSPEFLENGYNDEAYIRILYETFFNRAADDGGLSYWMQALSGGKTREFVLAGFVNSNEFDELCAAYGISRGILREDGSAINQGIFRFAKRLYTTVLERDADKDGVEYWALQIADGVCTPEFAAQGFFWSEEYISKQTGDEKYIKTLYLTFMNREADESGLTYWKGVLSSGTTRQDVLSGFAHSEEFKEIMEEYGL